MDPTPTEQAARRAAEHVLDLDCECMECEAKTVEAKTIILAEFAPLQERLKAMEGINDPAKFVEAAKALRASSKCERPLILCKYATGSGSTKPLSPSSYCDHCKANAIFDQAIAAKPTDPPKEAT